MAEWAKQKWCTPLSKDEIAEFLTKTERTECNNTKKEFCSMGVIYFLRCIRKKKKAFVYVLIPCRETRNVRGMSTRKQVWLRTWRYFEGIVKQLIRLSYDVQNHGPRCIKSSSLRIILHITLSLFQKLLPLHLLTFRTAFTDVLVRTMCWWPVKTVSRSVTLDCWTWWRTNRVSMPPERKMGKAAKLTYLYFQTGPLEFLLSDIR